MYAPPRAHRLACVAAALFLVMPACLHAQTVTVQPLPPTVGSSNPVSAEPLVARPTTTPCVVPLFTDQPFNDYSDHDTTYTPPANCKGPWAKVVFSANFSETAGLQYDRSAKFFLGGANIYFGTTPEPRSNLAPAWHVERDVTDLSALLTTSQPVVLSLYNITGEDGGVDYNGYITGSAELEFYPANIANPAPTVPDEALPLDPAGAITSLNATTDRLSRTFPSLPRNIEGAYLQLISQSQASDEFWYTCSPNSVATQLDNCGNTAFRETEVYIDGKAAGIAPVYPWIYTGGIDPFLWEPITGVQTLEFKPYMVDLTPFAGVLSNGEQHTVSIGVYNANNGFDVTGTLLLYLDHGATQVTGAVTEDTLGAAPSPIVNTTTPTTNAAGVTSGSASVVSLRAFRLSGYVRTSQGKVTTSIDETVNFGNQQSISTSDLTFYQALTQLSGALSVTSTTKGFLTTITENSATYPLTLTSNFVEQANGAYTFSNQVNQQNKQQQVQTLFGIPLSSSSADEQVQSNDSYAVDDAGNLASQASTSSGTYHSHNSAGACYSRALTSTNLKLTSVTDGAKCPGGVNR